MEVEINNNNVCRTLIFIFILILNLHFTNAFSTHLSEVTSGYRK